MDKLSVVILKRSLVTARSNLISAENGIKFHESQADLEHKRVIECMADISELEQALTKLEKDHG